MSLPSLGDPVGSNQQTLDAYQDRLQAYVAGTAKTVSGESQQWLDAALGGLPPTARLLELGSAFGRDAAYIAAQGYAIECSDAVPGFVTLLQSQGFNARRLNVLTDDVGDGYHLILANAVLLHFTRRELPLVLSKVRRALAPNGRLAFSLKQGEGEGWSDAKLGAPRFFCYWQPAELEPELRQAGFTHWQIHATHTGRAHADWLFVIAEAG